MAAERKRQGRTGLVVHVQNAHFERLFLFKVPCSGKNRKENKQFIQSFEKSLWNYVIAKNLRFKVYYNQFKNQCHSKTTRISGGKINGKFTVKEHYQGLSQWL